MDYQINLFFSCVYCYYKMCSNSKMQCAQILRLQTGVPTDAIACRIHVKRVGRDDGTRCFCSFLVVLACENNTSNFSLFSFFLLAILFLHFTLSVIESELRIVYSGISVETVQTRREADDNFKFTKYIIQEITLFFRYSGKILPKIKI